jgi:hypothetical protein
MFRLGETIGKYLAPFSPKKYYLRKYQSKKNKLKKLMKDKIWEGTEINILFYELKILQAKIDSFNDDESNTYDKEYLNSIDINRNFVLYSSEKETFIRRSALSPLPIEECHKIFDQINSRLVDPLTLHHEYVENNITKLIVKRNNKILYTLIFCKRLDVKKGKSLYIYLDTLKDYGGSISSNFLAYFYYKDDALIEFLSDYFNTGIKDKSLPNIQQ